MDGNPLVQLEPMKKGMLVQTGYAVLVKKVGTRRLAKLI